MNYQYLLYDKEDGIGIVTVNRPAVLNALNTETYAEFYSLFQEIEDDPDIRVVILTGSGEKAFIAGVDITEMKDKNGVEIDHFVAVARRGNDRVYTLSKPVIAAINGFAVGAGLEIALACTLRIASDTARFGVPEIKLGIMPGNGGTQRLPRLVGKGRAMEMVLTGELIDATEAYRIGLVNQVVPLAELMEHTKQLAKKLVSKSPLALKIAKDVINTGLNLSLTEGIMYEQKNFALLCGSGDKKEGVAAFLEKRSPVFKGR